MQKEIYVRQVQWGDLDACVELEAECYSPAERASRESIGKRIEVYPYGFLVAIADDRLVGMINSGATHKDDITDEEFKKLIGHVRNGSNGVVFSLAVTPRYRNMGIARRLLHELIMTSEESQKKKILLLCKQDHIDFYRKSGFSYSNVSQSCWNGTSWHEMIFPLTSHRERESGTVTIDCSVNRLVSDVRASEILPSSAPRQW